jgi:hypothetical protein
MKNYFYIIDRVHECFDSLTEARKFQKHLIDKDNVKNLFRNNEGRFYIVKGYIDNRPSKVILTY